MKSHNDWDCENVWPILMNEINYTVHRNLYSNLEYKETQLDDCRDTLNEYCSGNKK